MTIPKCGIIGLMATLFFAGTAAADQPIEIRLPQLASIPEYTVPLLELALSKQDRPFRIVLPENSKDLTAVEVMEKLTDPASSEFNLYAAGTSKHYEEIALPIRVPLVRGLIGARINAIPKGSQNKFLSVNTVGDLKDMTFLQGIDWGDIIILEGAGLTVKTARKSQLYPMIAAADADAYPRASVEILSERMEYVQLDYDIEQEVVLIYDRFPFYFFTGKHNAELAEIIETGLVTAYEDGSFIQYFRTHPMIREIFTELNLDSRRPIRFDNPNLTAKTASLPDYYWHKFPGEAE